MKIFLAIIFSLLTLAASSCLNIFAVDSAGNVQRLEHDFIYEAEFRQDLVARNLKNLEKKFSKNEYSYQNISDYGAYLLMAGRFNEGMLLFRSLSQKYPDIYQICANTAVAYELTGNIDSALYWEKRATILHPRAHNNSEWIHLKILEARKKLLSDPDWCLKNNVTGIIDSVNSNYNQIINHQDYLIFNPFLYQLEERLPFTYGEDKALGKLLFELGDAYQSLSTYRAYYCYVLAKYFYPALAPSADVKMQNISRNYPKGSVAEGHETILLKPKQKQDNEMLAPEERDVRRFVKRIVDRPALKNNNITFLPVEQLLAKI